MVTAELSAFLFVFLDSLVHGNKKKKKSIAFKTIQATI